MSYSWERLVFQGFNPWTSFRFTDKSLIHCSSSKDSFTFHNIKLSNISHQNSYLILLKEIKSGYHVSLLNSLDTFEHTQSALKTKILLRRGTQIH